MNIQNYVATASRTRAKSACSLGVTASAPTHTNTYACTQVFVSLLLLFLFMEEVEDYSFSPLLKKGDSERESVRENIVLDFLH